MSQVPIPTPIETCTRTHGYGFHAGVGAGGPIFTHGLPVTGPTEDKADGSYKTVELEEGSEEELEEELGEESEE